MFNKVAFDINIDILSCFESVVST